MNVACYFAFLSAPSSILPPLATHLLKYSLCCTPDPFALPAAGLPASRGGNAFARSALHFFAASRVMADAPFGANAAANNTNAKPVVLDFDGTNMADSPFANAQESGR